MHNYQRSARIVFPELPQDLGELNLAELWDYHQKGLAHLRQAKSISKGLSEVSTVQVVNLLQIKQALAERHVSHCDFCVHHCRVDRHDGEMGYCQLSAVSPYSGAYIHWGEEAPIRPTWAVFLGGCTMHCTYCHNWRDTFDTRQQALFTPTVMLQALRAHAGEYRTLSFIGGTPEPHLHTLIDCAVALNAAPELAAPLVFNSNATLSAVGLDLMEGVVDVYLPDYKHGNDRCAWNLTKISHYQETLQTNLRRYRSQQAGMLVRHLVLPEHLDCCTRPVLETLARDYPDVVVNVMLTYQPMYKAESMSQIDRTLRPSEKEKVRSWIEELQLKQLPF